MWVLSDSQKTVCQLMHSTGSVSNYTLQLPVVPLIYNIPSHYVRLHCVKPHLFSKGKSCQTELQ